MKNLLESLSTFAFISFAILYMFKIEQPPIIFALAVSFRLTAWTMAALWFLLEEPKPKSRLT